MDRGKSIINSCYPELMGKRIITVAFLLSIIIHLTAAITFPSILYLREFKNKLRAYRVDLVRPPIKEIMEEAKKNQPPVSQIHSKPPAEIREATISLDTEDSTYHPYTKTIKEKIFSYWIYPLFAQQNFIQGNLLISFRLDRYGALIDSKIVSSSGHEILDEQALKAVRSAHPFPPFPENILVQFLKINASFSYQLKYEDDLQKS